MKHLLSLALSLLLLPAMRAEVVAYPIPEGIPENHNFCVKVRPFGGLWKELSCYEVMVDMRKHGRASMAYFDFSGTVEVSVTPREDDIRSACIRPLSYNLKPEVRGKSLFFTLDRPRNLSIEVNGDRLGNLHLFAGPIETEKPNPHDPNLIYFGPGLHSGSSALQVPSGKTLYLAGGAVLQAQVFCDHAANVTIRGRGVLFHPPGGGFRITDSKNITIDGPVVVNEGGYVVTAGDSSNVTIRNLKAFSCRGWGDGIDLFCCSDVLINGVFLRNSDDCIAIYAHRWGFYGDCRNITVRNSTLWADVAHPINIATHGDDDHPDTLENLTFSNIDVLEHNEPQIDYQGCIAINASDKNLVRHVLVQDFRVEDFTQGQLVNIRVAYNRKYAKAPGRGIEDVLFKDLSYDGTHANISIIAGYDDDRRVKGVVFDNLKINGQVMSKADQARFFVGEHVEGIKFLAPTQAGVVKP